MEDIEYYDIPVYNFPYDVEEDDEDTIQDNSELRVCGFLLFLGSMTLMDSHLVVIILWLGYDAILHCGIRRGGRD